jgi:hypothetical protein
VAEIPESKEVSAESKRKTRILVNEGLGEQVARYLRDRGYNAVFVKDAGLAGRGAARGGKPLGR